ncbi:recombinase family protein [Thiothrix unzii]|jgi:DNA invertase Pin-like site-specific DNA recombinase|uniref:Recombinase family protein n=1 Tax=Thiothrix unzii TaxID=111769 RepID=A0A975IIH8_9GAMM|nr:recombinase family protein [Thiothrix unzii]MDX9987422.1 recombinase family protein [Thiothrix unzii]QTR54678.1 recombinase family protein [Thiothrix unzii]
MNIGYARFSTTGQSLDIQLEKLRQYGCDTLFQEKDNTLAELDAVLEFVREGDALVVTRLDRLACSLHHLVQAMLALAHKQVGLVVLDQGLDSRKANLYQTVLAMAEFDRSLVNERIAEGVAKAKAAGVKFGRKNKLTAAELNALRQEFQASTNKAELAKKYGLHRSSLYRLVQENNGGNE